MVGKATAAPEREPKTETASELVATARAKKAPQARGASELVATAHAKKAPQARGRINSVWPFVIPYGKKGAPEPIEFIKAIRTGLPGPSITLLSEILQAPKSDVYALLHITPRTAQRIVRSEHLDVDKSDHLVQLMKIYRRCEDVFKDREKALRWLKSPNFALGDQTPLSFLDTTEGIQLVTDTLTRIEYGVFA